MGTPEVWLSFSLESPGTFDNPDSQADPRPVKLGPLVAGRGHRWVLRLPGDSKAGLRVPVQPGRNLALPVTFALSNSVS